MTKQNLNLIKQMTKDYEPKGQPNPTTKKRSSFRDSMIQICYELAHTEEQMQILQRTNPQMYEYIREKFPKEQIDPERENFVYFPKKERERGGKMNARRRND